MSAYLPPGLSSTGEEPPAAKGASSSHQQRDDAAVSLRLICPVCSKDDRTARLDSLHTSSSHSPDDTRDEFLQRSAPPAARAMPVKTPGYGRTTALFAMGGAALTLTAWFLTPLSRHWSPFVRFCVGPALALYLGWLAGAGLLMWIKRPQMTKTIAEYMERMRAYEAEAALQQRAFLIWSRLYYCERDNIVFLPGTNETAPLEDTLALCYRLAEQKADG